ncbi:MAG: hypothetical protein JWQ49_4739, partial [Edaphobacter sp.]|nr:hypothetical protein [Edaphobacter sp.]
GSDLSQAKRNSDKRKITDKAGRCLPGLTNQVYANKVEGRMALSKSALLQEIKKLAYPSVLSMPTSEAPKRDLDGTRACRLCNEKVPSKLRKQG